MRWGEQGGQAILSFRALVQSNRFERAWTLLAHTYKAEGNCLPLWVDQGDGGVVGSTKD